MKRMTAKYPFNRQQHTPQKTVPLNRFNGISRTGWIVPARRRQPGRNGGLVKTNHHYGCMSHNKPALVNRYCSCPIRPSKSGLALSGYTSRIKSYPHRRRGFILRYASLPSRLARLRSTAVPKPREKVKQIRLWGKSFFNTKSFAPWQPIRFPLSKTSLISFLPFKCSSRLKRRDSLSALIGLLLVRSGEFIPALGPAAFQHQSSAPSFHSGAESEFTIPLNLTWLISPFHLFSPH